MPIAQVHGAEMYYEEAGSGPPLILSPGGLQGALSSYQPVMAPLSQAHRVIAYDRRFGGQSNSPLVVQTWDMVCQEVVAGFAPEGCTGVDGASRRARMRTTGVLQKWRWPCLGSGPVTGEMIPCLLEMLVLQGFYKT